MVIEFKGPLGAKDAAVEEDDPRLKSAKKSKRKDTNGHDELEPHTLVDITQDIKEREWIVPGHIPASNVSLLSGEGAIGKSVLAMQLAAVMAINADPDERERDWLGTLPRGGSVLYVSCEEDENELRFRLEQICRHYQTTRAAIIDRLRVMSWVDADDTQLMALDRKTDSLKPTPMLQRLVLSIAQLKPRLIILDTAADLFGGSEIHRGHTRQFLAAMRRAAKAAGTNAGVLMLAHPSLEGIRSGSGLSGSTAWHNSVRARAFFKRFAVKQAGKKGREPGDEEPIDNDLRVLEWMKNNYGPPQSTVTVRWQDHVYVVQGAVSTLAQELRWRDVEQLFIDVLRERNAQERYVSDKPSPSYAPTIISDTEEARAIKPRVTVRELSKAMERLFKAKRIVVQVTGPASRASRRIIEGLHLV